MLDDENNEEDYHVRAGRKGGEQPCTNPEIYAKNRMEHGIYATNKNYYATFSESEKGTFIFVYNKIVEAADSQDSESDSVVMQGELRDALFDIHKARSVETYPERESRRVQNEARRIRGYAIRKMQRYGVLEEGERSIARYFPESVESDIFDEMTISDGNASEVSFGGGKVSNDDSDGGISMAYLGSVRKELDE